MKSHKISVTFTFLLFFTINHLTAQLPVTIVNGQLRLNDGFPRADPKKYISYTDSLELKLKANPSDTTSLFYRAFLYSTFNSIIFQPYPGDSRIMQDLLRAKNMAEKAEYLGMTDFRLKILLAEICSEICYQYSDDQSWKFSSKQIIERRGSFDAFKSLTNKYYDDVIKADQDNGYNYEKLKVKRNYPIK